MRSFKNIGMFLPTGVLALASLFCTSARTQNSAYDPASSATAVATSLPADVYPDSGYRLSLPKRDDMDDYGKRVFDELTDAAHREHTGLQTPAGIRLYSPKLAKPMSDVFLYLRTETGLGERLSEIAILVTAREMDNQYEWASHEPSGLKAGVEPNIIDVIKYSKPAVGLGEKETVIIAFGRELFAQRKVSPGTFAVALRLFGARGTVDLASLMSQYAATSALVNAFDMQLPEGRNRLLPAR
jgi:4-carboxymuconolactone decarboxylase